MDNLLGGAGNDVINAIIDSTLATPTSTLTALDSIDGGAGVNTLKISAITDLAVPSITVANVQSVQISAASTIGTYAAAAGFTTGADLSTKFAGVTNLSLTGGTSGELKAPTTAAVTVSGITGAFDLAGGTTQTVTLAAQGGAIGLTGASGAVSFTSAKHGNNAVVIDNGTSVAATTTTTVTSSSGAQTAGAITIGGVKAASGATTVTQNLISSGDAAITGGTINVTAGTSANVTVNATNTAGTETSNSAITVGAVTVTSGGTTADVTVKEVKAVTTNTKAAVAVVKESAVVTFNAMKSAETLTFNGLTFTAAKDLTAAQVAGAFANLTSADTQSGTGVTVNGIYSGSFTAGWTSGAVNGTSVSFTAKDEDETNFTFTGTAATNDAAARIPTQVVTAGTVAVAKTISSNAVTLSTVRVDDAAIASIKNLTVDGYAAADLGNTGADLNAIATLSLANATDATATLRTTSTTLGLTVNAVAKDAGTSAVDLGSNITTLNLTAAGASDFNLTAAGVTALAINGASTVDLTGSTLTALKTVTVSGAAGATIDLTGLASQESVNTTGTTGTVSAKIDATKATYTGGAGVDAVTLTTVAPSKTVNLGAGNDTLTLASGTTTSTGTLSGGDGTDTLVMAIADAETAANAGTFQSAFDGFEKLQVNSIPAGAAAAVDMSKMDNINYVINKQSNGTAQIGTITFSGTENETLAETITTTITDSGGTSTFVTTVAANGAASAATVSAVTKVSSTATYTVSVASGVATITSNTPNLVFTAVAGATSGDDISGAALSTTTASAAPSGLLTLNKLVSGGTVENTTAGPGVTVSVTDAATGIADVLNVLNKVSTADLNHGTVTAANVETVNLTVTDTSTTAAINKSTTTLTADSATTVNVLGNGKLALTLTGSTKVALIDGSTATGALSVTSVNATDAVTIKGGAGDDTLISAATSLLADVLNGGAGADSLTPNKGLTLMYGGAGADTFNIVVASANVNSPSTIMDIGAGDTIKFSGATAFKPAKVTLDPSGNPNLVSYADAAIDAVGTNEMAWFQYNGNTYIVQEKSGVDSNSTFVNGTDFIVKIVGLVDLGTGASYNVTSNTLEIS